MRFLPLFIPIQSILNIKNHSHHQNFIVILGGSNSHGANAVRHHNLRTAWGRPHNSFATQFKKTLHDFKKIEDYGGSPLPAAICSNDLIPHTTRYATLEFLPNIGYIKDNNAELSAIHKLLVKLNLVGALTFVVNIYPGAQRYIDSARICDKFGNMTNVIGCITQQQTVDIGHSIEKLAWKANAYVISVHGNKSPELFGADSFHLNQKGHDFVFEQMNRIRIAHKYDSKDSKVSNHSFSNDGRTRQRAESGGVVCTTNLDEIKVGGTFVKKNVAVPPKEAKIAWTNPFPARNASVDFNLTIPLAHSIFDDNHYTWVEKDKQKFRAMKRNRIKIAVAFLISKRTDYDVAIVSCIGCNCECERTTCSFDTNLRVSATIPGIMLLYTNSTKNCIVRIQSNNSLSKHLFIQKIIVGLNDFRTASLKQIH